MARNFDDNTDNRLQTTSPVFSSFPCTCAMLFNYTSSTSAHTMFSFGTNSDPQQNYWRLWIHANDKLVCTLAIDDGFSVAQGADASTSANTWYHGLVTINSSSEIEIFQDGVTVDSDTAQSGNGFPSGIDRFSWGALHKESTPDPVVAPWVGPLAEFGAWNRVLSAAEITLLGSGPPWLSPLFIPNGLVSYQRGFGTGDEPDLVAGGVLSEINTVAAADHPAVIMPSAQIIPFPILAAAGGFTGDLTTAVIAALTGQSLTYADAYAGAMGAATMARVTPQSPSYKDDYAGTLSAGSMSITGQNAGYNDKYNAALTKATFAQIVANAITYADKYLASLTAATMSIVSNAITWTSTATVTIRIPQLVRNVTRSITTWINKRQP